MTMTAEDLHKLGKLTTEERALLLCDESSFHGETTGSLLTGHGEIHGQPVFVFASDQSRETGGFNTAQAKTLIELYEQAIASKAPVIGFFDSAGHRLRDDLTWFRDFSAVLEMQTEARGKSLQLAIIAGPCVGADAILASAMDIRFMIEDTARLHVTGTDILKQFAEPVADTYGSANSAMEQGLVDAVHPDEVAAIIEGRRLVDFTARNRQSFDLAERDAIALEKLLPDDPAGTYDMREIIARIVDDGDRFELSQADAENAITCLARLNGQSIGIMANQPSALGGTLNVKALQKLQRFARLCADQGWPLLSLIDAPGFLPQADQESIARHAANFFSALTQSKSPAASLAVGQAYGPAFSLMAAQSRSLAWHCARFGMMKAEGATYTAAEAKAQGLVTEVIAPRETRRHLIAALSSFDHGRYDEE